MPNIPEITISENRTIPALGLGLWKNRNREECILSVQAALDEGYRHFDTAQVYGNEAFVGEVLEASSIPRSEIFVTTKIAVQNFGYERALRSFEESLQKLRTDYVDLLLLHFPVSLLRGKSWRALEEIHSSGRARTIGVSNWTVKHLRELLLNCDVRPSVNQVELHVYLQQPELIAYCKEQGITVEAYSPLAHGHGLDSPVLAEVGNKHGKTPAQVMLRWCVEQGTVPLPKSTHAERIRQNVNIFDFSLDNKDMVRLQALNQNKRTCWDPTHVP